VISTRIIDNDMGKVAKVPLTGIGTIHGITMSIDFVTGQRENPSTKKKEDIIERVTLPEFPMGLVEMISADRGVTKLTLHCEEHLQNAQREAKFVEKYIEFVTPIFNSGKTRY